MVTSDIFFCLGLVGLASRGWEKVGQVVLGLFLLVVLTVQPTLSERSLRTLCHGKRTKIDVFGIVTAS